MRTHRVFENLIVSTVHGLNTSMVDMGEFNTTDPPDTGRRLRDKALVVEGEVQTDSFTDRRLQDAPQEPGPTTSKQPSLTTRFYDPNALILQSVPEQTEFEGKGKKPDGKAGGPRRDYMDVHFRIRTGWDKPLAWACLNTFKSMDLRALSFQLETIMLSLNIPRWYVVAIVRIHIEPAVWQMEMDMTGNGTGDGFGRTSFATSTQRPHWLLLAILLPAAMGAMLRTADTVTRL